MQLFSQPPALSQIPTLGGAAPDADLQEQVVINQVRAAEQWYQTGEALAFGRMKRDRERLRAAHWEVLVVVALGCCLILFGAWWSRRSYVQERLIASERAAAERSPYAPEAIPPVR